jgi:mannose-6-phosphate isomerase
MQRVIKFKPIYKEKIWGGRKLSTSLGREIPNGNIGESWELSDYGNDLSIIENGEWKGKTFREIFQKYPIEILGESFAATMNFPLLIKIIDAKEKLSVQVHPDDSYALEKDPQSSGKKEAWYILEADENAEIVCGFSENLDRKIYENKIKQNDAESSLQKFSSKASDAFMINPGTVHAIGGGNLLLEIQQSSDSTYRVYDYGRLGDDGKPRDLHIEKSLDVLNFQKSNHEEFLTPMPLNWENGKRYLFVSNDKFRFEKLYFSDRVSLPKLTSQSIFKILHILEGEIEIDSERFKKGDTVLITAQGSIDDFYLKAISASVSLGYMTVGTDWISFL